MPSLQFKTFKRYANFIERTHSTPFRQEVRRVLIEPLRLNDTILREGWCYKITYHKQALNTSQYLMIHQIRYDKHMCPRILITNYYIRRNGVVCDSLTRGWIEPATNIARATIESVSKRQFYVDRVREML